MVSDVSALLREEKERPKTILVAHPIEETISKGMSVEECDGDTTKRADLDGSLLNDVICAADPAEKL